MSEERKATSIAIAHLLSFDTDRAVYNTFETDRHGVSIELPVVFYSAPSGF